MSAWVPSRTPALNAGAQNWRKAERRAVAGGVTTDLSATTEYASRFDNGEDNP